MSKHPTLSLCTVISVAASSCLTYAIGSSIQIGSPELLRRLDANVKTESKVEQTWSKWAMIAIAAGE